LVCPAAVKIGGGRLATNQQFTADDGDRYHRKK